MDPEVVALIPTVPYAGQSNGFRRHPTDLDRYARTEFRDGGGGWMLRWPSECPSESGPCESENDGRLLRRFAQAIASFF